MNAHEILRRIESLLAGHHDSPNVWADATDEELLAAMEATADALRTRRPLPRFFDGPRAGLSHYALLGDAEALRRGERGVSEATVSR